MVAKQDFKHIVRIVNTDLKGDKPIVSSLRKIRGVGFMFANLVCSLAGIDKNKKTGYLLDAEVKKLEDIVKNPPKYSAPDYMLNRRRDYDTGKPMHLLATDVDFVRNNDIKRMKSIKSYRAIRHAWGVPVRGQRTKGNYRKNRGRATGVQKKRVKSGRM